MNLDNLYIQKQSTKSQKTVTTYSKQPGQFLEQLLIEPDFRSHIYYCTYNIYIGLYTKPVSAIQVSDRLLRDRIKEKKQEVRYCVQIQRRLWLLFSVPKPARGSKKIHAFRHSTNRRHRVLASQRTGHYSTYRACALTAVHRLLYAV